MIKCICDKCEKEFQKAASWAVMVTSPEEVHGKTNYYQLCKECEKLMISKNKNSIASDFLSFMKDKL